MEKPALAFVISIFGVAISTADILIGFQFISVVIPTGYAVWKWRQDYVKSKKKRNASNTS